MDYAFTFIENNGGLDTEKDYPYDALEEACSVKKRGRHVVTIDGHEDVPPNDEVALMKVRSRRLRSALDDATVAEFGPGLFNRCPCAERRWWCMCVLHVLSALSQMCCVQVWAHRPLLEVGSFAIYSSVCSRCAFVPEVASIQQVTGVQLTSALSPAHSVGGRRWRTSR